MQIYRKRLRKNFVVLLDHVIFVLSTVKNRENSYLVRAFKGWFDTGDFDLIGQVILACPH